MKNLFILWFIVLVTILCTIQNNYTLTFVICIVIIGVLIGVKKSYFWSAIVIVLFARLLYVQYHNQKNYNEIWCRQNWQYIDIAIKWILSQSPNTFYPLLQTPLWKFRIQSFLDVHLRTSIKQGSQIYVQMHWSMRCVWLWKLVPFSMESWLVRLWIRGVIEKIYVIENIWEYPSHNTVISISKNFLLSSTANTTITPSTQWILPWILLWDTSLMNKTTYDYFLQSWLVHLVSASWWNIMLIITIVTYIFIYVPIRYRKYLFLVVVSAYTCIMWENISFLRAFYSFVLLYIIPSWYMISRVRILLATVYILYVYNPYICISSWWFLLSIGGVYWLLFITPQIRTSRLLHIIAPTFLATLSLRWPLLYLTSTINIVTIPLSLLAIPLVQCIIIIFFVSFIPGVHYLVEWWLVLLYTLAKYGSLHWLFITFQSSLWLYSIIAIRICTRILLPIMYYYKNIYYYTKRD